MTAAVTTTHYYVNTASTFTNIATVPVTIGTLMRLQSDYYSYVTAASSATTLLSNYTIKISYRVTIVI